MRKRDLAFAIENLTERVGSLENQLRDINRGTMSRAIENRVDGLLDIEKQKKVLAEQRKIADGLEPKFRECITKFEVLNDRIAAIARQLDAQPEIQVLPDGRYYIPNPPHPPAKRDKRGHLIKE